MIIGPSYQLADSRAAIQRSVGWQLRPVESGNEKSAFFLQQVPGLTRLASLGAEIRGAWRVGSRLLVVAGATLYEVSSTWAATSLGTLSTSTGPVSGAEGLFQVVIVDGPNGYVLTKSNNAFAAITDEDFLGSYQVTFLDGRWQFVDPDTQVFYWTSIIDDATTYDALDFASAESAPDNIVGHIVDHRELWLFGETGTEPWFPNPSGDQVYQRNNGASIEVGCAARNSIVKMDNSIFWIGQDRNGAGHVYTAGGSSGYQPLIVSTEAVSKLLQSSTDLSAARSFVFQLGKQQLMCIKAPGLEQTLCYDPSVGNPAYGWHDRCELVAGELQPWRADVFVFAHGVPIVGDSEGHLYRIDPDAYTNDGDVLPRIRTSPHATTPGRRRVFFDCVRADVTVGETPTGAAPSIEMRYSNDGGKTWGNWAPRSTGQIGQYSQPVKWDRCGSARDRVWQLRCTDNARVSITGWAVDATEGAS